MALVINRVVDQTRQVKAILAYLDCRRQDRLRYDGVLLYQSGAGADLEPSDLNKHPYQDFSLSRLGVPRGGAVLALTRGERAAGA
jgi:hypothetical protein